MSLYFLSGLPRTGTTLLSNILNENKIIHVTPTSSLLDFLSGVSHVYEQVQKRHIHTNPEQINNIYKSIFNSYYSHIENPIVIDKWRGWISNVKQLKQVTSENPKLIYTYRPIEEIITSFLYLISKDPDNYVDKNLISLGKDISNKNRALFLWENGVVGECYNMLRNYLISDNSADILFLSYSDLIENPEELLNKVYKFLDSSYFNHNFNSISNITNDNDNYWGLKNLHSVRSTLEIEKKDSRDYLDESTIDFFKHKNKIFNLFTNYKYL